MPMLKIDFDGVKQAKQEVLKQAQQVQELSAQLTKLASKISEGDGSIWTGKGAERFVEAMRTDVTPGLNKVSTNLEKLGKSISTGGGLFGNIGKALKKVAEVVKDVIDVGNAAAKGFAVAGVPGAIGMGAIEAAGKVDEYL